MRLCNTFCDKGLKHFTRITEFAHLLGRNEPDIRQNCQNVLQPERGHGQLIRPTAAIPACAILSRAVRLQRGAGQAVSRVAAGGGME